MGWEIRGERRYYTRSRRVSGKVSREYVGAGLRGDQASQEDIRRRAERKAQTEALRAEQVTQAAAAAPLDQLCRLTDLLVEVTLSQLGYHQHARGEWRRKRDHSK
jgi:hypothetical protein